MRQALVLTLISGATQLLPAGRGNGGCGGGHLREHWWRRAPRRLGAAAAVSPRRGSGRRCCLIPQLRIPLPCHKDGRLTVRLPDTGRLGCRQSVRSVTAGVAELGWALGA